MYLTLKEETEPQPPHDCARLACLAGPRRALFGFARVGVEIDVSGANKAHPALREKLAIGDALGCAILWRRLPAGWPTAQIYLKE